MVLTSGEARGVWIGLSQQCQAIPYIVQSEWEGCCIHWRKTLLQINMHKSLCPYLKCFQCGDGVFRVQFSSEKKEEWVVLTFQHKFQFLLWFILHPAGSASRSRNSGLQKYL